MTIAAPGASWQLAEVNIARLKAPIDDPAVAPFRNALDAVNAVAERMDGFVWRHVDDSGNATQTRVSADPLVIYNASTWRDVASLEAFVWGTVHARFYRRRAEWFDALGSMHFALWWVPAGTRFAPADAMERLDHLERHGPSDRAFGWREAPGAERWRTARCKAAAAA